MRVVTNPPPGSAATELSQASSGATTQPRHSTAQLRPDPATSKYSMDSRPPCCTTRSWSAPSSRVDRWMPCGLNAADGAAGQAGSPQPGVAAPSAAPPRNSSRRWSVSSSSSASAPGTRPSMPPYSLTRIASPPGRATRSSGLVKLQTGRAGPSGSQVVTGCTCAAVAWTASAARPATRAECQCPHRVLLIPCRCRIRRPRGPGSVHRPRRRGNHPVGRRLRYARLFAHDMSRNTLAMERLGAPLRHRRRNAARVECGRRQAPRSGPGSIGTT